jgi:hypothetical protein
MATSNGYYYSIMFHFIKEFQNPFADKPFISEMEENYGSLWQFRDCVVGWTLSISRYKGYAHLFHKESNSPTFLPLNVLEKVILVEQFHSQYIVIEIQAMNADGSEMEHIHSIVVKIGDGRAQFDVDGILENLSSTAQEDLVDLFRSKYSPWTATDVESENLRLNQILLMLTRYLAQPTRSATPTLLVGVLPMGASVVIASRSRIQASNSRSTAHPLGCTSPRVRSRVGSEQPESARKRRRSSTDVGSSRFGLTHVDNQQCKDTEDIPKYENFTAI